MTTDNIVMWVTRRSIVDWDCAKTQTLLEDLEDSKINFGRNLVHLRKSHVCAKKLNGQETDFSFTQFLPNQKSFRWMLDCEWMDYLL